MRPLLMLAALLLVAGLCFAAAWALDAMRRSAQRRVRDIDALGRRKLSRTIEADSKVTPEEALSRAAVAVEGVGSRFSHQTATELIAFTGLSGRELRGRASPDPIRMPVRVAIRAKSTISGTRLVVLLDEDYGFHPFGGPTRTELFERYQAAFDEIERRIRAAA